MPRIRTLKPEHRQHRKVGALSDREYRLWVGMICEADDEGRLVADGEQLRALLWAFHPTVTVDDVESALGRLVSVRLVAVWWLGRTRYAFFPDWKQHQVISRPTPSKLPSPRAKLARSRSVSPHGALTEPSRNTPGGSEGIGREGKGKDRKGKEGNGEGNPHVSHDTSTSTPINGQPDPPTTRGPQSDAEVAAYASVLGVSVDAARARLRSRAQAQ